MYLTRKHINAYFDPLVAEQILASATMDTPYLNSTTKELEYYVHVMQGASTLSQIISSNTTLTSYWRW